MFVLDKYVNDLIAEDISRLLENQIPESKELDYKRELNITQNSDRKEFVFDVSSMANTDGGCFIYGIEETKDENGRNKGLPEKITGITAENTDKLFQQIEDLIKTNTDPSIANIALKLITVNNKRVLVLGIPKAFGLPTMVTFNETNKFYRCRNTGKYAVDIYELNQMFMRHYLFKDSIDRFRKERAEKVRGLKVFSNLETDSSCFLEVIPFSFLEEQMLDLSNIRNMGLVTTMKPLYCNGWDSMFNVDGFATFGNNPNQRNKMISYDQLFRNGQYEAYTGGLISPHNAANGEVVRPIYGAQFAKTIVEKVKSAIAVLKLFKIQPPYYVGISLYGTIGARITDGNEWGHPIMTAEIILPAVVLSTGAENFYQVLKPNFDILWQASGFAQSPTYSTS